MEVNITVSVINYVRWKRKDVHELRELNELLNLGEEIPYC